MAWAWFVSGLVVGACAAAIAARWALARHARKERDAERRARSAERLAEIGAMTGGLAHEIKNPLSTIGLNAQLLEEAIGELSGDDEERARLRRRIGTLRREVERLRGILTDFLEYAGEVHLTTSPTDLNALVDELADFFSPQAERQGVRLRTDPTPGLPEIELDAAQVKQAVLNLMLNAVQAMDGQERERELILRTERNGDTVQLHVTDTGPGMDAETAGRIFNPYFTTKPGGSGLGLPMARRLVEAHDGSLELFTEPGSGTSFTMNFPVSSPT